MIYELKIELEATDLEVQYNYTIFICLLFMDDIDLLARSANLLQEVLNISSLFLKKQHLKVNIRKSAANI